MAEERTLLVLGATGGIGSELARSLARDGSRLVLAARGRERLEALAGELPGAEFREVDATDAEAVQRLVDDCAEFGNFRGVANCVGSILLKPAHLTRPAEVDETMKRNLGTAFNVVRASVRPLRSAGGGSILLFGSAAAETGMPNHEAIAAAKAAVAGLTRSAASTYAGWNIRVNCLAPGLVDTPMSERITANEKSRERSASMHPLGRIGRPQDVASLAAWLLSREADWITGQVIGVDGGLAALRGG